MSLGAHVCKLLRSPGTSRPRRESGQAAVESAIVLPLFVFLILGTLQLSLMHQARLIAKYAAYKAVRIGALTSANKERMERAALAVLLPTIKSSTSPAVFKTTDAMEYLQSYPMVLMNRMPEGPMVKYVEVMVCSPNRELLGSGDDFDFDDEGKTGSAGGRSGGPIDTQGWKDFDRGRLSIQVTYNYRLVIPFADMMMYYIFTEQDRADLMWVTKMKSGTAPLPASRKKINEALNLMARNGTYVFPIRTNFVMRMQSTLYPNLDEAKYGLPAKNECQIRFPRLDEGGGGGGTIEDDTDDDTPPED